MSGMNDKKWDKDYPQGGFVAEAVCPHCGELVKVNVPATPESLNWIKAKSKCPKCKRTIFVQRWPSGEWTVWDS